MYDTSSEPSPRFEPNDLAQYDLEEEDVSTFPTLVHALHHNQTSILSLAADENYIYSGSQAQDIFVWSRKSLSIKATLSGHSGSVLALDICDEKKWLFSASGDSTLRIWSTVTLNCLYVITPYLDSDSGDIFSIAYSRKLSILYFGCQNTSIQWLDLSKTLTSDSSSAQANNATPTVARSASLRPHKFFDSLPQPPRKPTGGNHSGYATPEGTRSSIDAPETLHVPPENVIQSAHYGYVYCATILEDQDNGQVYLITGSGNEDVKVWLASNEGIVAKYDFPGNDGAVLSLVSRKGTIYAGCQDGKIKILDLETRTLVRTLIAKHPHDVLSLSLIGGDLYACLGNGWCQRWSSSLQAKELWMAHDGVGLSSIIVKHQTAGVASHAFLVTGGSDSDIKIWEIDTPPPQSDKLVQDVETFGDSDYDLQTSLASFVSFPSVSHVEIHREDCRQAALWLKQKLIQLGAEASLLAVPPGINPPVLATFKGSEEVKDRPRILFYGHYDVIPARKTGWNSNPFSLHGENGYFYGRGVSDNKGPILATAFAISALRRKTSLGLDLVMLIEGEEESGSRGFEDIVLQHKDDIGRVDAILVSNSYWIGERDPCITFGLRGVLHATLEISNSRPDLHSGVEGGGVSEPMFDMVALLGKLSVGNKILIPGFYDHVRPLTKEEIELYELLAKVTGREAGHLSARWREPSVSIHSIETSGPRNRTVIPSNVKTQVSIRIVPDQELSQVAASLEEHMQASFKMLGSPNSFSITVDKAADWWLGNLDSSWFQALESAVEEEWCKKPLRIREGGSIPSIPFLEKSFGCPALHLPMGQSTDQAHLANERISFRNLLKGKGVLERFFSRVAAK